MRKLSIQVKLLLAIGLTMAATAAASAALLRSIYARNVAAASEEALRGAIAAYDDIERSDIEKLSTVLEGLVGNPAIREAFAAHDRDRLQAASLPIHQALKADHGINHWNYIEGESKKFFLRVHLPAKFGDVLERQGLLKSMARLENSAAKDLGKSEFALRVGKPVFGPDGKLVGYIELGEGMKHFLSKMKAQTGNDFAMFIAKKHLDESEWARTRGAERNNWNDFADVVVVNSTTADQIVDDTALAGGATSAKVLDESRRDGVAFVRGVSPIRDAAGAVVGGLVVRRNISALYDGMRRGLIQALAFLLVLAIAACALVYVLIDRLVFRRLRAMTSTMEDLSIRLAGGDYGIGAAVQPTSGDEIGQFEKFFGEFLALVGNTLKGLVERQKQVRAPARLISAVPPPPPLSSRGS